MKPQEDHPRPLREQSHLCPTGLQQERANFSSQSEKEINPPLCDQLTTEELRIYNEDSK